MSLQPGWDRNVAGGYALLVPPLPPEDPAPPLPVSRELGDASKGIETRELAGCGRPNELSAAPQGPGYAGLVRGPRAWLAEIKEREP